MLCAALATVSLWYLTCADLDSVDLQYFPDNDARNLAAVNTVAKGIRKAVGDVCVSLMRKDKENTLVLVAVDEIGTEPTLLRALCSINSDFSRQIRKILDIPPASGLSFRLIVAGTGSDAMSNMPGSLPSTYTLVKIPSHGGVWTASLNYLETTRGGCGGIAYLASLLKRSPIARDLGGNPRMALLIKEAAIKLGVAIPDLRPTTADGGTTLSSGWSDEVASAHLSTIYTMAARDFKCLNGLLNVNTVDAINYQSRALQAYFGGDLSEALRGKLCGSLGILTDEARWVKDEPKPKDSNILLKKEGGLHFVAPKRGRFGLSPTQLALFRLRYGYAQQYSNTWGCFEESVAEFVRLALIGYGGRADGANEFLRRLNVPEHIFLASPKLLNVSLKYSAVSCFTSPVYVSVKKGDAKERASPQPGEFSTAGILALLKKIVAPDTSRDAFVILNAPHAPFADVIVVVPHAFIVLIQCKFYKTSKLLNSELLNKAFTMMNPTGNVLVDKIKEAAGLRADGPVLRAVFTSCSLDDQLKQEIAKHAMSYVWDNVDLAPLSTPQSSRSDRNIIVPQRYVLPNVADNRA